MGNQIKEGLFRSKVVKFLKQRQCEVIPQKQGRSVPDMLVVPQGVRMFFIEIKGLGTGHGVTKGQRAFQIRALKKGHKVLILNPLSHWKQAIDEVLGVVDIYE